MCYLYGSFPDSDFVRFKVKRRINILFICAAFGVIFGGAANGYAQNAAGGYKTIPPTDAMVLEAADVSVAAHNSEGEVIYNLSAVQSAERQTAREQITASACESSPKTPNSTPITNTRGRLFFAVSKAISI